MNNPNNEFSTPETTSGSEGDDVTFATKNGIPIFMASPTGEFKKYDPTTGETSMVGDIVVDPKYTTYHEIKSYQIYEMLTKLFPDKNEMDIVKSKVKNTNSWMDVFLDLRGKNI